LPSSGLRAVGFRPSPPKSEVRKAIQAKKITDGTVEMKTPRKKACHAVMKNLALPPEASPTGYIVIIIPI